MTVKRDKKLVFKCFLVNGKGNKMKTHKLLIGLVVLLSVISVGSDCFAAAVDKIDLKLNLTAGQKFGSKTTVYQKTSQTVMEQAIATTQDITIEIVSEVLAVDAENIATVKTTYKSFNAKGSVSSPGGSFEYDSANPDESAENPQAVMMSQMFKNMSGAEFVVKLSNKGEIVAIEGFDKMLEKMFSAMEDPELAKAMGDMMKNFMSEDKLKEMNSGMFAAFPDGAVSIGDMWDDIISLGGADMPIDVDTTYMLKERKDGTAVLGVTSKMDMGNEDSKLIEIEGMKMNMQLTGTQNGTMKLDEATGWVIGGETTMSFSGSVKLLPNEHMPEGMTIPMTIEGTTKIEPFDVE